MLTDDGFPPQLLTNAVIMLDKETALTLLRIAADIISGAFKKSGCRQIVVPVFF